jgi:hypothetical protein
MAMRTCEKCRAAENPLGRLRFSKSRIDGKVYCENCSPEGQISAAAEVAAPPPVSAAPQSSAGLVVIPCPSCRSVPRGRVPSPCEDCADYGSVRIPANFLNVYRPQS